MDLWPWRLSCFLMMKRFPAWSQKQQEYPQKNNSKITCIFFQTHPAFEAGARASTGECDGDGRKAITITTTCTAHSFHQFPNFPCAPVSLYFLFSCSVWWTCQRGKDGGKWSCLWFGNCRCLASIVFIDDFDDVVGNGYDKVVDMDDFVLGKPILLWFR